MSNWRSRNVFLYPHLEGTGTVYNDTVAVFRRSKLMALCKDNISLISSFEARCGRELKMSFRSRNVVCKTFRNWLFCLSQTLHSAVLRCCRFRYLLLCKQTSKYGQKGDGFKERRYRLNVHQLNFYAIDFVLLQSAANPIIYVDLIKESWCFA